MIDSKSMFEEEKKRIVSCIKIQTFDKQAHKEDLSIKKIYHNNISNI